MSPRLSGRIARHLLTCVFGLMLALPSLASRAGAAEATIAVAANFAAAAERLADAYQAQTGHRLVIATGSTGQLFAQVLQGAPYDAMLAADQARPARLHRESATAAPPFTYATGQLVFWSPDPDVVPEDGAALLASDKLKRIVIANPKVAPYGLAARQTLEALGQWVRYTDRLIMGQSIAQAFQITAVGGAPAGFVALAQLRDAPQNLQGSRWAVPERLHAPIHQDAVLLQRGAENAAARGFLEFLRTPEGCVAIRQAGYKPGDKCP